MSITDDDLIERILIIAHEDVGGLWEIIGEGRNIDPDLSAADVRGVARRALKAAIEADWTKLMIGNFATEDWQPVREEEVEAILANPLNFYPPASDIAWHVRVDTTDAGEAELRRRWQVRRKV